VAVSAARDDWLVQTLALSALLGDTWFGAGLPVDARARLEAVGSIEDVREGTILIREGRPCDALGVLVAGRIGIRLALPGLEDRRVLTIEPGDIFGWSAVVPPSIATSTCVATAPSRIIRFEGVALRAALATDCELAAVVYERVLVAVARRLSATRMQLLDVYRSAVEPW
jgi:CRP-like cAMP-binding protein